MLSVASLPIGAPGPTLHWRNTDMEQVVFMVMVINFMMMMKVMMPELAQHRHGAGDLVMVCPLLLEHVKTVTEKDAAIMKTHPRAE